MTPPIHPLDKEDTMKNRKVMLPMVVPDSPYCGEKGIVDPDATYICRFVMPHPMSGRPVCAMFPKPSLVFIEGSQQINKHEECLNAWKESKGDEDGSEGGAGSDDITELRTSQDEPDDGDEPPVIATGSVPTPETEDQDGAT